MLKEGSHRSSQCIRVRLDRLNVPCAIVDGLKARGQSVKAGAVHAITTADFPTKAKRPSNSRLDLGRLKEVFGISMTHWEQALGRELDLLIQLG